MLNHLLMHLCCESALMVSYMLKRLGNVFLYVDFP